MAVVTVLGFFPCCLGAADEVTAFGGMYFTSPVIAAIKGILNIGVVLVLLQSIKWANSDMMAIRRGEFYELLLVTLFGMYLMISGRHFLVFVIGLEKDALVDFSGNRVRAIAGLVPVAVGDYVLVHAGCILQKLSAGEAQDLMDLFEELEEA